MKHYCYFDIVKNGQRLALHGCGIEETRANAELHLVKIGACYDIDITNDHNTVFVILSINKKKGNL